jgi:MFS family permease
MLLLLRLHDLGVAVAAVPLLWAALHVVRALASYPGGWLSDVVGPRRAMVGGWMIYVAVCFGLATAHSPMVAAGWFLVFGLVAAATESPERAFVAAVGRAGRRGRNFGAYHAAVGLAALPGGVLFGILYQGLGAAVALAVSGTLSAGLSLIGLLQRGGEGEQ